MGLLEDSLFCMKLFTAVFTMFKLLNDENNSYYCNCLSLEIYVVILIRLYNKKIQVLCGR